MKGNYLVSASVKDDFNIAGMYFLEYNLRKNKYIDEEELLSYISSIIEAVTIKNCIDDINMGKDRYLKIKNQEIRWLAAKTRFRAKSKWASSR